MPRIQQHFKPKQKIMKTVKHLARFLSGLVILFSHACFSQQPPDWLLEKMPVDLETDFALSALPPHLRDKATVYLLDPKKGYYIGRQGTNGFSAFVVRTEWERAEFVQDMFGAISFDAEGRRTHMPVFFAAAEMRASGKSPAQIKDIIIQRIKDGTYQPPSRVGVSYMLSPLLRVFNETGIVNQLLPHYMFYAPGVDNADIGGKWDGHGPFAIGSTEGLDKEHSIFNFIIIPAGETEKAQILEASKDLLRRLAAYKPFLKITAEPIASTHQH
jgi:hypothetical protein